MDPSVARNTLRSSTRSVVAPGFHRGPRKEEPPFADGRFDDVASCLLEGLRVREVGVVGTLSALEDNNSQEDLVVR